MGKERGRESVGVSGEGERERECWGEWWRREGERVLGLVVGREGERVLG